MTAERTTSLHILVPDQEISSASPGWALAAALRLCGASHGCIVRKPAANSALEVEGVHLSPEEAAACRSLARRLWQHHARASTLSSSLGGATLLGQSLMVAEGQGALIAVLPGGGGRATAEQRRTIADVAALLAAVLSPVADQSNLLPNTAGTSLAVAPVPLGRGGGPAMELALRAIAGSDGLVAACESLLDELVRDLAGVDFGAIWQLEPGAKQVRRFAANDAQRAIAADEILPLGEGHPFDAVVRTGRSRAVQFGARGVRGPAAKLAKQLGVKMMLLVPLRSRKQLVGILTLAAKTSRQFDADEVVALETLAGPLGVQLDGARRLADAQAQQERLQALLGALPVGIAMLDRHGCIVLQNDAMSELCGQALPAGGEPFSAAYDLRAPDGRPLSADHSPAEQALRGQVDGVHELLLRQARGGREIPVLVNAAPIRDAANDAVGVVVVYQDISRLREVDRLKDDFINTVSHELRTPTTTIRGGALTLLRRGDQLDEEVKRQLLADMAEEGERLFHLVEDLLVMARTQAGMLLQTEPIIPHRFVNDVIVDLGGRVGQHALTLSVPEDLPLIEADPTCLSQVLRNLFANAVKFSPKGRRIEITAAAEDGQIVFSVLDRGSGIPASDMDAVFEPFYKTADAVRTGSQGAGLGLAVCRRLIEVQGGRIWAERRHGGGTAFRFTLPALQEAAE